MSPYRFHEKIAIFPAILRGIVAAYITLCAIPADAQESRQHVASVPLDPFAIERHVAQHGSLDVTALWRELGLQARLQTVYARLGVEALHDEPFFDECTGCVAEIFQVELDGESGKEVVLKLYQQGGFCRFLIFRGPQQKAAGQWRLLGHADHDFARYYMPEHRVETRAGKRFFVMKAQGVSGSGVALAYDRWYEVDSKGVREVMSLPAQGHQCFEIRLLCREFTSHVGSRTEHQGVETIQVLFTVAYTGDYALINERSKTDFPLFTKRQWAIFTRTTNSSAYRLDPLRSTITTEEIRTVYNIDSLSNDDFLKFNSKELLKIATGRRSQYKVWLQRYLEHSDATPERAQLMRLLRPGKH